MNLTTAANQWASRPVDETFANLQELRSHLNAEHAMARECEVSVNRLRVVGENNEVALSANPDKAPAKFTHWSFDQFAQSVKAPAGYLRTLPSALAVSNLQHGLSRLKQDDKTALLLRLNGNVQVRSVTSPGYTRIWNKDVVGHAIKALDMGWMVPPARPSGSRSDDTRIRIATAADIVPNQDDFGLSVKVGDKIAPAGIYASDRDMFLFLVNPERTIDDGSNGLMRGAFVWNSEVKAGAFKVRSFMLENVCGNHICWGASGVREVRIVHRGNADTRFVSEMQSKLHAFNRLDDGREAGVIKLAKSYSLGKNYDELAELLYGKHRQKLGLTQHEIENSYNFAVKWENTAGAPPTSAWGFIHGLTRFSQLEAYTDARNRLDTAAGTLLELVAQTAV